MIREDYTRRRIRIEDDVVVLSASDCAAGRSEKRSKSAAACFAIHGNSAAHPQVND